MFNVKTLAILAVIVLATFCCGVAVGFAMQLSAAPAGTEDNTASPLPVYNLTYNNTTVNVPLDSELVISLPENGGSTGYLWDPAQTQGLDLLESKFRPANTTLIGAPGDREFLLRASWTGEQCFKATLHRSWENLTGTEEVFILNIRVS
jgi:predicted secreted protein